ncbi:MAG: rod shape-determining protein MreD [Treponema sp.]|nr:rod shape-determining protein MreD [Treponema sp.]
MAKSILLSSFILFCVSIIESSILSNVNFLFVVPDFVLICSVYFSLLNGKTIGVTTGFISGLFLDFITGVPFGFNCIIRTIIGYVYGFFSETLIVTGFIMPMFTVGIATIVKHLLIHLISILFPNVSILAIGLISYEFLFEFVVNILLSPFVFKFLGLFRNSLSVLTTKDKMNNAE